MKRLIVRQPLFNAREVVTAYELVLSFDTEQLLSGEIKKEELPDNIRLSLYGSNDHTDEKLIDVCIDITPAILLGSDIQRLSKKNVILYLREPFNSKPEHLSALERLKADGFRVGLGSFATDDRYVDTV